MGPGEHSLFFDTFGDIIPNNSPNTLRIGFQNIGGFPLDITKLKEDIICTGFTTWSFDVFGTVEMRIDWQLMPKDHKLYYQTKEWWDTLHLSYSLTPL